MLRTASNFSNIRNRVPAHISRHQTFDIVADFVGNDKQISPLQLQAHCGEGVLKHGLNLHQNIPLQKYSGLEEGLSHNVQNKQHSVPTGGYNMIEQEKDKI